MCNALARTMTVGSRGQLPLSWKRSQGKLHPLELGPVLSNSKFAVPKEGRHTQISVVELVR